MEERDGGAILAQDASIDSGETDAGDAVPPAPYDFSVQCASAPCVVQIAARGGAHACAVLRDGTVRCWGANRSGQLGPGLEDSGPISHYETRPRRVIGVADVTAVAATGHGNTGTTCVVAGQGAVACFGSDVWGQLGRASGADDAPHPEAALIDGLRAKSIALANTFALAIATDGRLWSWGMNDALQLASADPTAGPSTPPSRADRVDDPVRSCAGTSSNGFALTANGDVLSWGGRTSEQLGRNSSAAPTPIPGRLALSEVSSVAAGAAHACAVGGGRVHCWGQNEHGQLGTGTRAEELFPDSALLPERAYAVAVAAGGDDTCVITADGDVYCWGANDGGQLGVPAGRDRSIPSRIDGLGGPAVALAVMDEAICALLRSGSVECWGDNLFGQLGRGSRDAEVHVAPAPVTLE